MKSWAMRAAAFAAAWLPSLVVWIAFVSVYARVTLLEAVARGVITIGTAALLGIGVAQYCSRTPWPRQSWIGFYAKHIAGAALYGASWIACLYTFDLLLAGTSIWLARLTWGVLAWYGVVGLWLYGAVAGVSYAIRSQRESAGSERRALQLEASLAAARLDALRSRLHPHFLFNALHTIGALVRSDPALAEAAVEKLGDILRYTLRDGGGEVVPFSEEWEFTRRYLEFEQLRYGDRLAVVSDIDPASLDASAPSFALQTLVENAVRHSIDTRPAGGRIDISVRRSNQTLSLRVRDDGGNGLASTDGAHYGLAALRARLDSVYGGRAELKLTPDAGGFEALLSIPAQRITDADEE